MNSVKNCSHFKGNNNTKIVEVVEKNDRKLLFFLVYFIKNVLQNQGLVPENTSFLTEPENFGREKLIMSTRMTISQKEIYK
jgi:hypothetical protein